MSFGSRPMLINPYAYGGGLAQVPASPSENYFKNVSLFVSGAGVSGSSTVSDYSLHKLVPSSEAGVYIDGTDSRYGTTSVYVPAASGLFYQSAQIHQALYMGTYDFTIEVSARALAALGANNLFLASLGQSEAAGRVMFFVKPDGKIYWNRFSGADVAFGATVIDPTAWHDYAFIRSGTNVSAYVDGVLVGTITTDSVGAFASGTVFGNGTGGIAFMASQGLAGRLANVRVTRGLARPIAPMSTTFNYGYDAQFLNLQFEGAQGAGSASVYDSTNDNKAFTLAGGTIDSAYPHWGRTALNMTGASSSLAITPAHTAQLDVADFTLSLNVLINDQISAMTGGYCPLVSTLQDSSTSGWRLGVDQNNKINFSGYLSDGTSFTTACLRGISSGRWKQVDVVRSGQMLFVVVDDKIASVGVLPSTTSRIKDTPNNTIYIGSDQATSYGKQLIDNVRLQVGQANYALDWPALPSAQYPTGRANDRYWDDVILLVNGDQGLVDTGVRPKVVASNTAVASAVDQLKFGVNTLKFVNGSTAQLNMAADAAIGTADFTVEFDYFNSNTAPSNNGLICARTVLGDLGFAIDSTPNALNFNLTSGSGTVVLPVPNGAWCHVTFMRRGDKVLAFADHKLKAVGVSTGGILNLSYTGNWYLGQLGWQAPVQNSYVANLRVTVNRLRVTPAKSRSLATKAFGKRYARLDSWDRGANITLGSGDLQFVGEAAMRANIGVSAGKWYWEVTSNGNRYPIIGVGTAAALINTTPNYPGTDANGWSYYGANAKKINNAVQTAYGFTWAATTDVIGVYLDCDGGTLGFTKNGVDMGVAFTGLQGLTLYPMVGGDTSSGNSEALFNFGQSAFSYTPPGGWTGWNQGLFENNADDTVVYTPLTDQTDYHTGLRITGDGEYGGNFVIEDSGRFAFRQTAIDGAYRYTCAQVGSGTTSLYLPSTGTMLHYPVAANIDWTQPRWTMHCWFYENAASTGSLACRRSSAVGYSSGSAGWAWTVSGLRAKVSGVWSDPAITFAAPAKGAWHHAELVRDGANIYQFVDGVLVGSLAGVTAFDDFSALDLYLGTALLEGQNRFDGYINDFEVLPGVVLHTANFTPTARAAATPPAVNPTNYPSLKIWFDATDNATLTVSGSNVTGWKEKISGNVFAYTTANAQPTLAAAGTLLGQQCVNFGWTATSSWLTNATGVKARAMCTIFMVGYWGNRSATYASIGFIGAPTTDGISTNGAAPEAIVYTSTGGVANGEFVWDSNNQIWTTSNLIQKSTPFLVVFQLEQLPANSQIRLNGRLDQHAFSGTRAPETLTFKSLGSADSTYGPNGAFGEIAVFEGPLSPQDKANIKLALAQKWKLP